MGYVVWATNNVRSGLCESTRSKVGMRLARKHLPVVHQVILFIDTVNRISTVTVMLQEFACNGTVIEHPEYGEVLQLQGDQRENICQWLTKTGLAKPDQLKVHGF
ncbi:Eukaryotic translation initiation factor 1b [Homalodisca vitripennis]|nr:Eukaryotic translation initiation factor 1b [Homalodisca vitripennis]